MWAARPFLIAYVVVIGFTIGLLVNRSPGPRQAVPAVTGAAETASEMGPEGEEPPLWQQVFHPSQPTARWLLRMGLPMLTAAGDSASQEERRYLLYVTGHGGDQPQTFFQTMLPFLRPATVAEEPSPPPVTGGSPATPKPPKENVTQPAAPERPKAVAGGQPLVGIYHTHDWESYISEFPAFKVTMPRDLNKITSEDHSKRTVMGVGKTLALKLFEHGVTTVYADYTHKDPGYVEAYKTSRSTARDILKRAPTVKVLLDLHRDFGWGMDATTVVAGKKVAQIRCIIGKSNTHWQQNQAFCDKITARLEEKHPGITLPTRVQDGDTYNQDLMTGAILLEIGTALNHYDEADRSAVYLAEVLADMLRNGEYPR